MTTEHKKNFETKVFLSTEGVGRTLLRHVPKQNFFFQGNLATAIFYLQSGRAKLTVVSKRGKEATITLLSAGDFFGEESMAAEGAQRMATATAISICVVMKIEKDQMLRALHDEHAFSNFFMQFIVNRGLRTQADLIDQLFNSSERRLARTLLIMANFGEQGEPVPLIPPVTQETLAEMIGTTRSRVSFFMNRFRKLGYIDYNGRIRVHESLLNMILHDSLPAENASRPVMLDPPPSPAHKERRAKLA